MKKINKNKNIIKRRNLCCVFIDNTTRSKKKSFSRIRKKSEKSLRAENDTPSDIQKAIRRKCYGKRKKDKKDLKPSKVIKVYDFLLESNREKLFLLFFPFDRSFRHLPAFECSFSSLQKAFDLFQDTHEWNPLNWLVMYHHRKQLLTFSSILTSLEFCVNFSRLYLSSKEN